MQRSRLAILALLAAFVASGCATHAREIGLCREHQLRTRPFASSRTAPGDVEQITYVAEDDALWVADDNARQIYIIARGNGALRARLRERDFVKAFGAPIECDDGDGNPDTKCTYTSELEGMAYEPSTLTLYVMNTVNDIKRQPPVDKAALFVLRKDALTSNFRFVDWREMPRGQEYKYTALVSIEGRLFVSVFQHVYGWDLEANDFAETDAEGKPVPAFVSPHGPIVGLAWDRAHLWMLSSDRILSKIDWNERKEIGTWDLQHFGIGRAKGLAVAPEEFFVVDGNPPNPIHVFGFHRAPRISRAGFLGGWPNSCD
jgi:hypothetical protein